jgi:hypothetical protein
MLAEEECDPATPHDRRERSSNGQTRADRGGGVGGSTALRTASSPAISAHRGVSNDGNGKADAQIAAAAALVEQQCAVAAVPWQSQS